FTTEGLAGTLMAETNPENGNIALDEIGNSFDGITERGRIAGAVGKKNSRWFVLECFFGGSRGRHDAHLEAMLAEAAQNVVLHPEVVGDDGNVCCREDLSDVARFDFARAVHKFEIGALGVLLVPEKGFFMRDL